MLDVIATPLPGLFHVKLLHFQDERGDFIKIFNHDFFKSKKFNVDFKESYISTSKKNVIRGMHFQIPPHEHAKVVHVISGSVLDVVLDIRKSSPTYGQSFSINLRGDGPSLLYIPAGMAHGFLSLEDESKVLYMQTSMYAADCDKGIAWNSFGYSWPLPSNEVIISKRDSTHPLLKDFNSPF